jgi:hypothetical protein
MYMIDFYLSLLPVPEQPKQEEAQIGTYIAGAQCIYNIR